MMRILSAIICTMLGHKFAYKRYKNYRICMRCKRREAAHPPSVAFHLQHWIKDESPTEDEIIYYDHRDTH